MGSLILGKCVFAKFVRNGRRGVPGTKKGLVFGEVDMLTAVWPTLV